VSDDELPLDATTAIGHGDGISRGRIRRTAPLVSFAARTAGEAVVVGLHSRLTNADTTAFHVRAAERYADLLGHSKGALMKAGQMLSLGAPFNVVTREFQPIYQAALGRLRNDAPPMPRELACAVLEHELGCDADSVFAEFDYEPLAAASIGQVHAARLHDGREVAVKIQYPGVAGAIDSDLKNVELLGTFLRLVMAVASSGLPSVNMRGAARELRSCIIEELDYRREAADQAEFADLYRGHPFIHVPDVIAELCTGRVLTQELVRGRSWSEALGARRELRDRWAEAIYRFIHESLGRFGFINADPHPGNYLFHDDGSVSFLDFGCVKRYERELVEMMTAMVRASMHGDTLGTWRAAVEAGFIPSSDPVTPEELLAIWRESFDFAMRPQPFTVTPPYVARLLHRRYAPGGELAEAFGRLTMAPEFMQTMMLGRTEAVAAALLAELRATNDWRSIVAEHIEGAAPSTAMGKLQREFFAQRRLPSHA
jgi:predicted unusual protein kinase regulating ubiquinone biosynthesis (AarF/ABC1/UbiB family)